MRYVIVATAAASCVLAEEPEQEQQEEEMDVMLTEIERNAWEFKGHDVNEDGFLSQQELTMAFQLVAEHDLVEADQIEFFDKMDENLDGKISFHEYRDPMRSFTVLLRKQFEHLDIGNDGSLDEHELTIGLQEDKLVICDADADGVVVLTEFIEGSLRTLFPDEFVQGDATEIGVDKDGQPLPAVRKVPAPEGLRYAAAVVARDAHIYDPYVKFQDMQRMQGSLGSVMSEVQEMIAGMASEDGTVPDGFEEFMEGGAPDLDMLQNMMAAFGGGADGGMGALSMDGDMDLKAGQSIEDVLSQFDNAQIDEDARRLFGRPSLRELMANSGGEGQQHLEL